MRCLALCALLVVGGCLHAPQGALGGSVVKRDDNADLERLLEAIQRENEAYKDTDRREDKYKDTDRQEMGSEDGRSAEQVCISRNNLFLQSV